MTAILLYKFPKAVLDSIYDGASILCSVVATVILIDDSRRRTHRHSGCRGAFLRVNAFITAYVRVSATTRLFFSLEDIDSIRAGRRSSGSRCDEAYGEVSEGS